MAEFVRRRNTFTDSMPLVEIEVSTRPEVEGFLEEYERRNYFQIMKDKYRESGQLQPIHLLELIGIYKKGVNSKDVGEYIYKIMKTVEKSEESPPPTGLLLLYNDICFNSVEATTDQINALIAIHALEITKLGLLEEVKVLLIIHDIPERHSQKWLWYEVNDHYKEDTSFDEHSSLLDISKNIVCVNKYLQDTEFTQSNLQVYFSISTELNFLKSTIIKLYNNKRFLTVTEHMNKYFGPQFHLYHEDVLSKFVYLKEIAFSD